MLPKMRWAKTAALLAGVNLAAPQLMTFAGEPTRKASVSEKKPAAAKGASDVVLTASGEMSGRVISAEGTAIDGAAVTVKQNGKLVAQTTSDAEGQFTVSGMKSGLYQVSAGSTVQPVRLWQQDVAPPAARSNATIVQGTVVRGQDEWDYFETDEMVIAGIATAALVVGIVALVEANDDDDKKSPASP